MLLHALRIGAAIIATLTFYAAFFTYEDEEGRLRDKFTALWVRIDDRAKAIDSKSAALFNEIARIVNKFYDRLFGPRLLSWKMLGVSTACSLSMALGVTTLDVMATEPAKQAFFVVLTTMIVVCAIVPVIWPRRWTTGLSLMPLMMIILYALAIDLFHPSFVHVSANPTAVLVTMFAFSVTVDMLFTLFMRKLVRYIASNACLPNIYKAMGLLISVACLIPLVPVAIAAIGLFMPDYVGKNVVFIGGGDGGSFHQHKRVRFSVVPDLVDCRVTSTGMGRFRAARLSIGTFRNSQGQETAGGYWHRVRFICGGNRCRCGEGAPSSCRRLNSSPRDVIVP